MSVPQPDPLTDLTQYMVADRNDGYGGREYQHLAMTRTGTILAWGVSYNLNNDYNNKDVKFFDTPYGVGYHHLEWIGDIYSHGGTIYGGIVLDKDGFIHTWGETVNYQNKTLAGTLDQSAIDEMWWKFKKPIINYSFEKLYKAQWVSVMYYYSSNYNRYERTRYYTDCIIALRDDGSYYIYYRPATTNDWQVVPAHTVPDGTYNPKPAEGMVYNSSFSDLISAGIIILNHDPILDKDLQPMSGNANVQLHAAADKYTSCTMSQQVRVTCEYKPLDLSNFGFTQAILDDVQPANYAYGKCHFHTIAILEVNNGHKAYLSGGVYSLYADASLGATDTNLIGYTYLTVSASKQRCIARNWDLMGQIQDELGISP